MRFCRLLVSSFVALLLVSNVYAEQNDATRSKLKERFDVAMKLFDEGNNAAALAEFQRAYSLSPNPVVLFNIGLVYAAMGRSVEAVDALEKVLQEGAQLSDDDRTRAISVFKEQSRRIGQLNVAGVPENAVVQVDGVEVGRTPLSRPLRVSSGNLLITVVAEGYHPSTQAVTVAGEERREILVKMVPLERKSGLLELDTDLLDAKVLLDGNEVGQTPTIKSLSVAPGIHRVELRRDGYRPAMGTAEVAEGGKYAIRLQAEPDEPRLGDTNSGFLRLSSSEGDTAILVDGRVYTPSSGWLRLPTGRHTVTGQRSGFLAEHQVIDLPRAQNVELTLGLRPTPETYEAYVASARRQRFWAYGTLGAGVLIGLGSSAFYVINEGRIDDAQNDYREIVYASEEHSGRSCDVYNPDIDRTACQEALDSRWNKLEDRKGYRIYGYVGMGLGAALAAGGVVLLAISDSPSRYDHLKRTSQLKPVVALTGNAQWVGLEGSF